MDTASELSNLGEVWVSLFRSATDAKPVKSESIEAVLVGIRDRRWGKQVQRVRDVLARDGEEAYKNAKKALPAVTFAGEFSKRSNAALVKHSGYICLDVDDLEDLDEVRKKIHADPYTVWCFLSPSMAGLKVGLRVPEAKDADEHRASFEAAERYYRDVLEIKIDNAGKDVARLCFVSDDPDIFVQVNAADFGWEIERQKTMAAAKPREREEQQGTPIGKYNARHTIEEVLVRNGYTPKGNRYVRQGGSSPSVLINNGKAYAFSSNDKLHGSHLVDAFDAFCILECGGDRDKAIRAAIEEERATRSGRAKKTREVAKGNGGGPSPDTSSPKAATSVMDDDPKRFYRARVRGKKHPEFVPEIPHLGIQSFLQAEQIAKIYLPGMNDSMFVQKLGKVFEPVSIERMRDRAADYLRAQPEELPLPEHDCTISKVEVQELFTRLSGVLFAPAALQCLPREEPNFLRDTSDSVFLPFLNGVYLVDREEDEFISWEDSPGCVWKNSRISREYHPSDGKKGDMARFCEMVTANDPGRFESLQTHLGYLMTRHKDPSTARAVVLCDERIQEDPDGRTGKSLLATAVGMVRNNLILDGRNFDITNPFAFQALDAGHEVITLDDITSRFPFTAMFHMVTGALEIERKGQQRIIIPFSDSPKFLITTNYVLTEIGGSFEDRVAEIELYPYFSVNHKPRDEFGRNFFDEWDADEWDRFYDFMIGCIRAYMRHGLIRPTAINLNTRKLYQSTSQEFSVWLDHRLNEEGMLGEWLLKAGLFKEFCNDFPDYSKSYEKGKFSQKRFSIWLHMYAKFNNLDIEDTTRWMGGKVERVVCFQRLAHSEDLTHS